MIKRRASAGILYFVVVLSVIFLFFFQADVQGEDHPSGVDTEEITIETAGTGGDRAAIFLAAMGAVGISCLASAFALAKIGSAALGAMSEKLEIGGRALIFLGMAEGIAIYGLIIAIMMLTRV